MAAGLSLSSCARLAFIGVAYVYLTKFIDTLWHGVFSNPSISFTVVSLNIVAGVAQFLFFFKLQSVSSNMGVSARLAGWAGTIGALINLLPKLLALSALLQFYFSFKLVMESDAIAVLSPWLSGVMLFCSCLIYFFLSFKIWRNKVRTFLVGAIGYLTLAGTFSMVVVNFFFGVQVNWQVGESGLSLTYFIISASFSFLCIAYFFTGFFRGNENSETEDFIQ